MPSKAQLLADAAAGTASPTATALASLVGFSRPALSRHDRLLVDELLASTAQQPRPAKRPRPGQDLEAELARVRRANEDLRRHVALYEEVIRQLTVDNTRLPAELDQHAGVTQLRPQPPASVVGHRSVSVLSAPPGWLTVPPTRTTGWRATSSLGT